jgi:hypothetical protein
MVSLCLICIRSRKLGNGGSDYLSSSYIAGDQAGIERSCMRSGERLSDEHSSSPED